MSENTEDVVKKGDIVRVKLLSIDEKGPPPLCRAKRRWLKTPLRMATVVMRPVRKTDPEMAGMSTSRGHGQSPVPSSISANANRGVAASARSTGRWSRHSMNIDHFSANGARVRQRDTFRVCARRPSVMWVRQGGAHESLEDTGEPATSLEHHGLQGDRASAVPFEIARTCDSKH